MPRAAKLFARKGIDIRPVVAEDVLLKFGSEDVRVEARAYLRSPRYFKRLGMESILRSVSLVDKDGRQIEKLARQTRKSF